MEQNKTRTNLSSFQAACFYNQKLEMLHRCSEKKAHSKELKGACVSMRVHVCVCVLLLAFV